MFLRHWPVMLLALLLASCNTELRTPQNQCVPLGLQRVSAYVVRANTTTPAGLPVDTSGVVVDLADIDRRAAAVAACLGKRPTVGCPVIKIAPVTHPSCVGPYELLDVVAPGFGCAEKGQEATTRCPCRWRVIIQSDGSVVIPPDLYNLGGALAAIDTGTDPWLNPAFAKCALVGDGLSGVGVVVP